FTAFRRNYLLVYLLVNASDWLCGPYLYSVYKEHGLDLAWISSLSIVGFLSSAVLGSYLGSLSDTYGRRRLCLLYPITFAVSCICIQFPSLPLLIAGRVFGGISTSLLFSVFETWMTSEYFKRGFPGSELGGLFSSAVTLNSLVAIGAGLVANAAADALGTSRVPFLLAIVPAAIGSFVVAWSWTENYGAKTSSSTTSASQGQVSVWGAIKKEPAIAYVGIVQACFEGAMYGFVCLFGAALDEYAKSLDSGLPFGLIFATFMIFCMIGSTLCNLAPVSRETLLIPSMLTAVVALYAAATSASLLARFMAFCFFELTVGLYFPLIFSLRSKVIPEQVRGTVLSMFRVPLNAIVVGLL
ncbi:molybdate-anion transporter MOT2, partial [Catenaria anguillulae PL171]